jgi:hypothetical protein
MAIKQKNDSESKSFWKSTRDARVKVESWPSWKRNLRVSQYSVGLNPQKSEISINECERVCSKKR